MDQNISSFDGQFAMIDHRSRELLLMIDDGRLFEKVRGVDRPGPFSCGECILRSAGVVEKTFGGIMARLWDDPFEWTLPEKLGDKKAVLDYLDEVETTRTKGFAFFTSDADLTREIPAPEKLVPIADVLRSAIISASDHQHRAFEILQLLARQQPPRT